MTRTAGKRRSRMPALSQKRARERSAYLALVRKFPLRPIRNDKELSQAVSVMDSLLDYPRRDRAQEDYLDVLGDLIKQYEDKAHPIADVSESEVLEHLIEAKGVTQAEVARQTGIAESRL